MPVYEFHRKGSLADADFPAVSLHAKVILDLEFASNVPLAAGRAIALRLLRESLDNAKAEDFTVAAAATIAQAGNGEAGSDWIQPADLDLRVVKSAHRMVLEVSQRGQSGKAVLASELVETGDLSAPTIGRLLKNGDPAHQYVRQYVAITPAGRTKALDLTPAGRLLASRIRANAVPH